LIDKPKTNPVLILNNQNVLNANNSKTFEDLPDGFKITYIDENDGYQENELYVMGDGSNQPLPDSKIEDIDMPFITNPFQVYRNGMYQLACRHLRPEVWNRKVAAEGALIDIGSLVEVQDDTILVGIGEGAEITGFIYGGEAVTGIKTDGKFDVADASQTYSVKIAQFDGINTPLIRNIQVVINEPGVYSDFIFNNPILLIDAVPTIGDIVAFGVSGRVTIDAICFGKKPNGDGTFDLTLIPYAGAIYNADISHTIPEFDSKVTSPQGLISSPDIIPEPPSKEEMYEHINKINDDVSNRPTYTEIVTGFSQAGVNIVPIKLSLSCAGGFRFISLSWGKQLTLSNLKEYEIQVSENAADWYAPRFDGADWKGGIDGVFATVSTMLVHPNIPPAGTGEEPEGRFLYYRVRQRTMLDDYSPWSEAAGARTKLADTGDYGVNSISANALRAGELFALFAKLAETLVIDPVRHIVGKRGMGGRGHEGGFEFPRDSFPVFYKSDMADHGQVRA
jgi:hypothetical protein